MSFLNGLGGAAGAAAAPTAAASGLGKLLHADPTRIGNIASRVGTGMNQIAAAGGATPGYAGAAPEAAAPANHMQLLDNAVLQKLIAQFGGQPGMHL